MTNVTFCHISGKDVTLWHTKIFFLTCDGRCHILQRCSNEKRRRCLLARCQLPHRRGANCMWRWGREKVSPDTLPAAVTAEAQTACGGGGTPAPAAVRPRPRQRDPVMHLPCPSPRNLRSSTSQRHVRQRQHLLLPSLSKQLEPLKQRRLIQVRPHCLQEQQFLSRLPRAARHIRLIVCSVDLRMLPLLVKVGALPQRISQAPLALRFQATSIGG